MGLDTELEFEKYYKVVQGPKVDLPSHCRGSKTEEWDKKGKPSTRSYLLRSPDDDFIEISSNKSWSSSCKSFLFESDGVVGNEVLKRGSIYQSSKEVKQKMGTLEERRKIEVSCSSGTTLSFGIVDSLCRLDEAIPFEEKNKSLLTSLNVDSYPTSVPHTFIEMEFQDFLDQPCLPPVPGCVTDRIISSDGFLEICLNSDDRKEYSSETISRGSVEQLEFKCDQSVAPLNKNNDSLENDTMLTLHKSSSEKIGMPYSTCQSECDQSKSSPKVRFSPFKRMLDQFMKSKSQRSPSVSVAELGDIANTGLESVKRNRTRKSLLNEFSNVGCAIETSSQYIGKDHDSVVSSSPAHLRGLLKLEFKNGVPSFEFTLKDPEDFLAAKTWREDNSFNWVYTFHSMNSRRKSNSSKWCAKERQKGTSMVGQMQVSCYLCSEMRNSGAFNTNMVTEFVLCDVPHSRKGLSAQESAHCVNGSIKPSKGTSGESLIAGDLCSKLNDVSDPMGLKLQLRHASGNDASDASTPCIAELHPSLEIAAVVVQVPFERKESLIDNLGDNSVLKKHSYLSDFSVFNQKSDDISNNKSPANVKVIIPSGTHGWPSTKEGGGPSPLLDRWRSGGGCDCGGWDMACPLVVFDSPNVQNMVDCPSMECQRPLEFFFQGSKDKIPALTIKAIDEGSYLVDFHARLSTLQAFSICVSILHSTEISNAIGQQRDRQRLHCDSLKMLLEEEVRLLIEAVAEEEKRKMTKRLGEIPPSFNINPPFSPIARV